MRIRIALAINDQLFARYPKGANTSTTKHQFSKVIQNNIYEQGKNPINGSLFLSESALA